jgi:Txe/YoeB family toxin of Txe-Axe toxin-antitoxin module
MQSHYLFHHLLSILAAVLPLWAMTQDISHSQNWLDANKDLWAYLSNLLKKIQPEMWQTATNFNFLEKKHLAGAWAGRAINQQILEGTKGGWHQDFGDSTRVFNGLVPAPTSAITLDGSGFAIIVYSP